MSTHSQLAADGIIDADGWPNVGAWRFPPPIVRLVADKHTPLTNTAAVISTLLASQDNGVAPGDHPVFVNDGCELKGRIDSCTRGNTLLVGPAFTPDDVVACTETMDCDSVQECMLQEEPCAGRTGCICRYPHQARWKYVVAHEAGHQVQNVAVGAFSQVQYAFDCAGPNCPGVISDFFPGDLVDPPWTTPLCGCQHLKSSNPEHCLQSIERSGPAQGEGIAQFFASRVWNLPESSQCGFAYYKEFLDTQCRTVNPEDCEPATTPDDLPILDLDGNQFVTSLPPVQVDCRNPARWRNQQVCGIMSGAGGLAGDFGTEYDWMGFLYNLNRPSDPNAVAATMDDIWLIYRHGCNFVADQPPSPNPPRCNAQTMVWDAAATAEAGPGGFLQGVQAQFAGDLQRIADVEDLSDSFGVGSDQAP